MAKKRVVQAQPAKRKELKQIHIEWDLVLKKNVYGHVPEEYHFRVVDGKKIGDLKELLQLLPEMENAVLQHHVTSAKNDFSTWVKDVFKESELAGELKKGQSPTELELTLQRHVNKKLERAMRQMFYWKNMGK